MRLEIDLSPELQARLQHVAAGLGMDVSEYIGRLVRSNLSPQPVQAQATAPAASVARAVGPAPVATAAPAYAPAPAPYAHAAAARQPVSVPLAAGPLPFTPEPAGPDLAELGKKFSAQVTSLTEKARNEAKYNSARHASMLSNHGGLETARILLRAETPGEFFKSLWQRKRLDLSVEALVIENPAFHPLFTESEIATARSRLRQCNYSPNIKKR
jgi:hypothetical protein